MISYRQPMLDAIRALPMHVQHNLALVSIMRQIDAEHHEAFVRHRERYARAMGQLDMQLSLYAVIGWNIKSAFYGKSVFHNESAE